MAVKEVIRMGHPILAQIAEPVEEFNTLWLETLIEDMFDTMAARDGAGLAAPQIAVPRRVVIFGVQRNPRYPEVEEVPTTVLINPQISVLDDTLEEDWEGCLSLPGLRGRVPRYRRIRYTGFDQNGDPLERTADGFHARVVQHEVDHLDGILYPQRMTDMRSFGYEQELFPDATISPLE